MIVYVITMKRVYILRHIHSLTRPRNQCVLLVLFVQIK